MSYNGKTDWKLDEMVYPEDMNRIEGQIEKNTSEIEGVSGKIGNPSDGEEQLTLFGKLAAILSKILGIDTKVGTSDDAKTRPTLFGKIAGIGDTLSENLTPVTEKITEVLNKVTGIDGKIGTAADGAEQGTLFGKVADAKTELSTVKGSVEQIKNTMPTGIVKSVQKGSVKVTSETHMIDITAVNPNKSLVIVRSDRVLVDRLAGDLGGAELSDEGSKLIFYGYYTTVNAITLYWQVIEFY